MVMMWVRVGWLLFQKRVGPLTSNSTQVQVMEDRTAEPNSEEEAIHPPGLLVPL